MIVNKYYLHLHYLILVIIRINKYYFKSNLKIDKLI